MPRLITRHQNRKLYDPTAKRYVALGDIVSLLVGGDSVRIIEHPSGDDATARILAQALVDLVKRRAKAIPEGLMETLVRLAGGGRAIPLGEASAAARDLGARASQQAEAIAARLVTRGRLGIEEALHLRKEVEDAIHSGMRAAETAARRPIEALRPGRDVSTIASLARELKSLETLVITPPAARKLGVKASASLRHSHTRTKQPTPKRS